MAFLNNSSLVAPSIGFSLTPTFTFIVAAPLGWYFATHSGSFFGRTAEISVTNASSPIHDLAVNVAKEILMFNYHGDYNWRQNISGAPELFWPVGILFILGIALAILGNVVALWPAEPAQKFP